MGFKNILCEKPLVSRVSEVEKVQALIRLHNLKLYAIDSYLPKALGLRVIRGLVPRSDPRCQWLTISDASADFGARLGEIEGVGVRIIEAGKFGLPDIVERPYLATRKDIGGMILDLVTHVCGPLYQSGLLDQWTVLDASLSRLSDLTTGHLVGIKDLASEVEMYVTALLAAEGVPLHLTFGKVPATKGGLWSLEVRARKECITPVFGPINPQRSSVTTVLRLFSRLPQRHTNSPSGKLCSTLMSCFPASTATTERSLLL